VIGDQSVIGGADISHGDRRSVIGGKIRDRPIPSKNTTILFVSSGLHGTNIISSNVMIHFFSSLPYPEIWRYKLLLQPGEPNGICWQFV